MERFLIYGANGYVGRAVAALALERGLRPVLGGRSAGVKALGSELGAESVIVAVDDAAGLAAALADVPVVLNCAGPFHRTYRQVFDACLATGTHYLDISGERVVYEAAVAADQAARRAAVMLLPGVGFDIVPTDCLAAHLARRLSTASHLRLAFMSDGPAAWPPGSVQTLVETAMVRSRRRHLPVVSRQHRVAGQIVEANPRPTLEVDFGPGPTETALITWGDIDTAEKSTGIPNVDVYHAMSPQQARQMDLLDRLVWLLRFRVMRDIVKCTTPTGATAEERAATTTHVWGEVVDADGNRAVGRLHGPEGGREWTSRAALDVVTHVLAGEAPPGHQTPSTAYGPDLVMEANGVSREDIV